MKQSCPRAGAASRRPAPPTPDSGVATGSAPRAWRRAVRWLGAGLGLTLAACCLSGAVASSALAAPRGHTATLPATTPAMLPVTLPVTTGHGPASAQFPDPFTPPAAVKDLDFGRSSQADSGLSVSVKTITPATVPRPGTAVTITVEVTNTGPTTLTQLPLEVRLSTWTTIDRGTLVRALNNSTFPSLRGSRQVGETQVASLEPGASRTVTIPLEVDNFPSTVHTDWGPRIVTVQGEPRPGHYVGVRSVLNFGPATDAVRPTPLLVLNPIGLSAEPEQPTGTQRSLHALPSLTLDSPNPAAAAGAGTGPTGRDSGVHNRILAALRDLPRGPGRGYAIDPALLATSSFATSAEVRPTDLGVAWGPEAGAALDSLNSGGSTVVLARWARPDLRLLAQPGLDRFQRLATDLNTQAEEALGAHLTPGLRLGAVPPSDPSYQDDANAVTIIPDAWLVDEELNYHPAARISLPQPTPAGTAQGGHGGEDIEILRLDSWLSAATIAGAGGEPDAFSYRQLAGGFLAQLTKERPAQPRLTVLSAGVVNPTLDTPQISAALAGQDYLLSLPWVRGVDSGELDSIEAAREAGFSVASSDRPLPQTDQANPSKRPDLGFILSQAEAAANLTATLSGEDDVVGPALLRQGLWLANQDHNQASYGANRDRLVLLTQEVNAAVTVQALEQVNIISENAHLPVSVRNALPQPVAVQIRSKARDSRVRIESPVSLRVAAASVKSAQVPLKTVGNGTVFADIAVTSPSGERLSGGGTVSLHVRAGVEGWSLRIIGVALVTILIVGVIRSIIRGRRFKARDDGPALRPPLTSVEGWDRE